MAVLAYQASSVDLGTMDPVYTVGTVGTVAPWAPWTLRAPGLCAPIHRALMDFHGHQHGHQDYVSIWAPIRHSWTLMGTSMVTEGTRIM